MHIKEHLENPVKKTEGKTTLSPIIQEKNTDSTSVFSFMISS